MLQIASGKLFTGKPAQINELRGVLYTNLDLYNRESIITTGGRLLPTSFLGDSKTVVYELTEKIEDAPVPGAVASHGIDPYLNDFAAIVSFALNVTCSPDAELTRRLISGRPGLLNHVPPRTLVRRVFDDRISCQDSDADQLVKITDDLIGLQRKDYRATMRAIRNYVTGLHRLADDPELTYTLLVASIESLAHGFDNHSLAWEDYPERERNKIDGALEDADNETKERVTQALLEIESVAATRRFYEFALDHVRPSFFREEAFGLDNPVGRGDLSAALRQAYNLRSRHVHTLSELPALLTTGFHHGETINVNGVSMLTFQGMTRLTRHVITEYIKGQPKTKTEIYDYRRERTGIVEVPLAPQYWIGQADDLTVSSGQKRLEGFLAQIARVLRQDANATVTDLRQVLAVVEKLLPNMSRTQRKPFLALYILYNKLVIPNTPMKKLDSVMKRYEAEVESPSTEALLLHLFLGTEPNLTLEEHQAIHDEFLQDQGKASCVRIPARLKACLTLALAERFRSSGNAEHARQLMAIAIENYPGQPDLCKMERCFELGKPITWHLVDLSSRTKVSPVTELTGAGQVIFQSDISDQR